MKAGNVIIDSSVWIDHLRKPNGVVRQLLEEGKALSHSWIIGELATGQIKNRHNFLGNLKLLTMVKEATVKETLDFLEAHQLYGRGLSFTDVHVVASALLSDVRILTRDKPMIVITKEFGIDA